ncbi:phosphodiester glycosidase family protein [bacterium]|nr:phosphodiester glycosidase family protein [bacterium]
MIGQIFLVGLAIRDNDFHEIEEKPNTPSHFLMTPPPSKPEKKSLEPRAEILSKGALIADEVKIIEVSLKDADPFSNVEIILEKPVKITTMNRAEKFLRIQVEPSLSDLPPTKKIELEGLFNKFSFYRGRKYAEILFYGKGPLGEPIFSTLENGFSRISIPFRKKDIVFPLSCEEIIEDGLRLYRDRVATKAGWCDVFILRANPSLSSLNIFPVLANEGICQKEVLSSLGRRYQALAGVNGAYFTSRGDPIGTLIINRRLISSPIYNRSVFGLSCEKQPIFGNPNFSGSLSCGIFKIEIDGVNQPRGGNQLMIYTPEFARSTLTTVDGIELVVVRNRVIRIERYNALIPPDGIVVSAGSEKAATLAKVRLGDLISLDYHVSEPWDRIQHAVCGGPRLIWEGRIDINGHVEHFDNSIRFGRHPRTALAQTFNGDLLFLVADGRTKRSSGMQLTELAEYLKNLGARFAINMDGGGSSSIFVRGKILNHPSDGKERPISNAILISKN